MSRLNMTPVAAPLDVADRGLIDPVFLGYRPLGLTCGESLPDEENVRFNEFGLPVQRPARMSPAAMLDGVSCVLERCEVFEVGEAIIGRVPVLVVDLPTSRDGADEGGAYQPVNEAVINLATYGEPYRVGMVFPDGLEYAPDSRVRAGSRAPHPTKVGDLVPLVADNWEPCLVHAHNYRTGGV